MVDTRHSIKSRVDLAFRREPPPEKRGRESRGISLASLALASIHPFPLSRPGCRAALAQCRALAIARARDLLFHQLVPFLRSAYPIYPSRPPPLATIFRPPSSFPDLRAPRPTVDLLPLPLFALPTSLRFVFRVIKDHPGPPTSPSRYARLNRIDFRLPRSRRRQNAPAPASRSKEEISSYS